MKKSLAKLAKELDFELSTEYFDYCLTSYINGNFSQCGKLFKAMRKDDQKGLIRYIESERGSGDYLKVRDFYFSLL